MVFNYAENIFRCEFCLSDWTTIDEWVAHRVGVHDPTYRPTFVVGIIKGALSALGGQARRSVLDEENAENGDGDDEGEKNDGEEKKEDYAVYRPISDSAKRRVSNDLALGEWSVFFVSKNNCHFQHFFLFEITKIFLKFVKLRYNIFFNLF